MIEQLAAESKGDFSQKDGEVVAVKGLGGERMEPGEKFVDRVAGLLMVSGKSGASDVTRSSRGFATAATKNQGPHIEVYNHSALVWLTILWSSSAPHQRYVVQ